MKAGLTNRIWTYDDLLDEVDDYWKKKNAPTGIEECSEASIPAVISRRNLKPAIFRDLLTEKAGSENPQR